MNRDGNTRAGLPLAQLQGVIADVLPAHADDVAAPLSRIKEKAEGEPFTGADRPARFKLCDVAIFPHAKTGIRCRCANLDASSWVFGDHGHFDGDLGDGAQSLQQTLGSMRRGGFLGKEAFEILRFHPGERQPTTVGSGEACQDP